MSRISIPRCAHVPVCGLTLLSDFKASGEDQWEDGQIYSADEGATYSAKMALLDANTLTDVAYRSSPCRLPARRESIIVNYCPLDALAPATSMPFRPY